MDVDIDHMNAHQCPDGKVRYGLPCRVCKPDRFKLSYKSSPEFQVWWFSKTRAQRRLLVSQPLRAMCAAWNAGVGNHD